MKGTLLDYVWIKALFLVAIHLSATWMRPLLEGRERFVNAFGAGMAISYVFIQLLPEIAEGKEHLGMFSFIIVLVGYIAFYFIELHARQRHGEVVKENYRIQLLGAWLYSLIIVVGFPDSISVSHLHVILMAIAIGIHLLHTDYELGRNFQAVFDRSGKYLLATAPLVGLVVRWSLYPESDIFIHMVISLLAGSLIYSVAREELPNPSRKSLLWFVIGILFFTGLLLIINSF